MKKTLFAMLALATMMPAIGANWEVRDITFNTYSSDTALNDYKFYVIERAGTEELVSSVIASQPFSEFSASAGAAITLTSSDTDYIYRRDTSSFTGIDKSVSSNDIWGVVVYQNSNEAMFQVLPSIKRSVRDKTTEQRVEYLTFDSSEEATSYTSFKPESPATPEPATATLSLLALAGLATRRRRRK